MPNTRNVLKAFHYLKYSTDFDFVKVFLKDFTAFQIFSTDGAVFICPILFKIIHKLYGRRMDIIQFALMEDAHVPVRQSFVFRKVFDPPGHGVAVFDVRI